MRSRRERNLIGHFLISLAAVSIFFANISYDGLWHPDAPSHALNGVFYMDMIEEGGFLHPMTYAERYYVQYPALTIGMYPPIFYTIEAFVFKVFGISALAARFAVLSFTLLGVNMFFLLCRMWFPLWLSVVGGILYLLQPVTLFGQKNVMVEMPALAMSIVAIYFLCVATERGTRWAYFWAPLFAALAFLTKQNTIFLIPIWCVWIIADRKWKLAKSRHFLTGIFVGVVVLIPWVIVNLTVTRSYVEAFAFQEYHLWSNCLYYLRHCSDIVSYPVVLLSVVSVILWPKLRQYSGYKFALLWGLSVLLSVSVMEFTEPRYAMFLVPAMIILSVYLVRFVTETFWVLLSRRSVYPVLLAALICLHLDPDRVWSSRDIQGFQQVANFVERDQHCVSVLYDGYFDEDFIFHMRALDKDRRVFVFRASKLVFSTMMIVELAYNELITQPSEFLGVLDRYSIKYLVQEERDLMNTPANRRLRQWIKRPEFRLVKKYSITSRKLQGFGSLLVYEYLDYEEKPITQVDLDMPIMGRKISVKLE
jgi:hypothetical protein